MLTKLKNSLSNSNHSTLQTFQATKLIKSISMVCFVLALFMGITTLVILPPTPRGVISTAVSSLIFLGSYLLAHKGKTWLAGLFLTGLLWLSASIFTFLLGGLGILGFSVHVIVIIIASLLFGYKAGLFYFLLSAVVGISAYILEATGVINPIVLAPSRTLEWIFNGTFFTAIIALLQLSFRTMQEVVYSSRIKENDLQRRAVQIQVAAEVAREATAIREVDRQLDRAVNLITARFGYYYAAIYLNDEESAFAVLKSATGEAGRRLLESGYKLSTEQPSIVCYVTRTGKSRIASDIDRDSQHLRNPLLPNTRSEMALPLKVNNRVIGVLDVQNLEKAAFDNEDVAVLQILADQLAVAFESARLYDAAQRQLRELTVLHSVAVASALTTSEDELIERATQIIGDAFYPQNFGIILLDETSSLLVKHASYRELVEDPHGPYPLGTGITGRCAQDGEAWRVGDTTQEPSYWEIDPNTRSELCVPLSTGDKIIGVINTESTQFNAFSESDERLLSTLAGQLATGILKIRLYEGNKQQIDKLEILLEASMSASTSLDMDAILKTISQQITLVLHADGCIVSLSSTDNNFLQVAHSYSTNPRWQPNHQGSIYQIKNHPDIRSAIINRQHVTVLAKTHQEDSTASRWVFSHGCKCLLIVPLVARDRVLGIIEIISLSKENEYSADEIGLCLTLTNLLSTSLDNARLFEAEHRRSAELEALRRASLRLTSSLELQPVLETILEQALKLVNADKAHIFLSEGNQLTFGAALSKEGPQAAPMNEPPLDEFNYSIVQSGQQIFINDMSSHPYIHGWDKNGSIIGLPLRVGSQILGVMSTAWDQAHRFNPDELRILELFADQASLAMDNARLFTRAQNQANELSSALAQVQELDRVKNEFVQSASHELRTPLAIALGYAELLAKGELGELQENQQEPMTILARRLHNLNEMLDNLLTIVENEASDYTRRPVDLGHLVEQIISGWQNQVIQKQITFQVEIPPNLPLIFGTPDHLKRAVENLLSNALKFTPDGGKIAIRLWESTDELTIEVSDSGIGMSNDQLEQVFKRFHQANSAVTRRYSGISLGLALVREIAESHGGRVSAESVKRVGTKVRISIPIAKMGH